MTISSRTLRTQKGPAAGRSNLLTTGSLLIVFMVSSCVAADARLNEDDELENMFSPPAGARQGPPAFDGRPGPAGMRRENRKGPGWQQVMMIPSLSPQQRAEIRKIFLSARQDMAPLRAELTSLRQQRGRFGRQQRPGGLADAGDLPGPGFGGPGGGGGCARTGRRGGARGPGFDRRDVIADAGWGPGAGPGGPPGMGFDGPPGRRRRGQGIDVLTDGSRGMGMEGPEGLRGRGMGGPMADPAVRAQLKNLRDKMRTKREEVWQKVQIVLTPQQRAEFEQMRKGELMIPSISR